MTEPYLQVRGLTVAYGDEPVVTDVSFEVMPGRLVGVVGPNGAGKSTMLKAILGTMDRVTGTVRILGDIGPKAGERVTYVPQRASIDWDFPITVREVVMQGRFGQLGLWKRPRAQDQQAVDSALQQVGMAEFANRQVGELSGGQRQRVFLARALAQGGDIYVMDEPFQGVDAATETAIVEVLRGIRESGGSVVVVHHDLSTVADYFDDVAILNNNLIAFGPSNTTFNAENLKVAYGGKLAVLDSGEAVLG